ncbi:hypothetical protein AXF42_Ash017567 [Apostasia shenzhenica]|uniref:Uncharacterized protein n=1 Tax=Apostasia shenzhenica TaxID=1088818 RepID=A0A2I0A3B5_9ASPA|nr:hypothetical protein AXF42_Ash017567 [Apostasia shenzhenica]
MKQKGRQTAEGEISETQTIRHFPHFSYSLTLVVAKPPRQAVVDDRGEGQQMRRSTALLLLMKIIASQASCQNSWYRYHHMLSPI